MYRRPGKRKSSFPLFCLAEKRSTLIEVNGILSKILHHYSWRHHQRKGGYALHITYCFHPHLFLLCPFHPYARRILHGSSRKRTPRGISHRLDAQTGRHHCARRTTSLGRNYSGGPATRAGNVRLDGAGPDHYGLRSKYRNFLLRHWHAHLFLRRGRPRSQLSGFQLLLHRGHPDGNPLCRYRANPNLGVALGGIIAAGIVYGIIALIVMLAGYRWIEVLMPPVVTGAVVMAIGLNLAPVAIADSSGSWFNGWMAIITVLATAAVAVYAPGPLRRLPILLGGIIGYIIDLICGALGLGPQIDFSGLEKAPWIGLPHFTAPTFTGNAMVLIAPVAVILVAENTGHVKAVAAMTG